MKETIKSIASICGMIIVLLATILFLSMFFVGVYRVMDIVYPIAFVASGFALLMSIFIFLPLLIWSSTRPTAAIMLYISSYIFGFATWCYGFILAFSYWGLVGLLVGLFMGGLGVVPIGFFAAIFHAAWAQAFGLLFSVLIVYALRITAQSVINKIDQQTYNDSQYPPDDYIEHEDTVE